MPITRTTIMAEDKLIDRVNQHIKSVTQENLTEFYTRAIINQLENDGDFEIRDELEENGNANK